MNSPSDTLSKIKDALKSLHSITDDDAEYRDILDKASQDAHDELYAAGVPIQIGYTAIFHAAKRSILREKYGLNWTPPKDPLQ